MRDENGDEFIQTLGVLIVKPANRGTVEIQYTKQSFAIKQRHDDFRVRRHVAGDMSRKLVHVRHDDRLELLSRNSAYALAQRNSHTRRITLKRSQHQLLALQKIKP